MKKQNPNCLQCGGFLYRLHSDILKRRLDIFKALYPLPMENPDGSWWEGSHDGNPIRLPETATVKEWDYLLKHMLDEYVTISPCLLNFTYIPGAATTILHTLSSTWSQC